MKIGLVGGSYRERSLVFDAQRSINLHPVVDQEGKEVSALYACPGLLDFADASSTFAAREGFRASNGRCFFVIGATLYELSGTGDLTSRGDLFTSSGNVTMDENGFQLGICDGKNVYMFTYATDDFTYVSDVDLPLAATLTFLDGYFIVSTLDGASFFYSNLYDGLAWNALDFASAESSPDKLLAVYRGMGQLFLFGDKTTEVWTNTGASDFPWQKYAGADIETGILAPYSLARADNTIIWVGKDDKGAGIVYRASGFTPQRISTHAIEQAIARANNASDMKAFTYQQDGHVFYMLTGGGLETSLCFDLSTGYWHERAYKNERGEFETHLAACCIFAFNKILVGSRVEGKIYQLTPDAYDDAGTEMVCERTYTHISDEGRLSRLNSLEIGFETGTGTQTGQGQNPVAHLWISKDGARTWIDCGEAPIGAAGNYDTRVSFRRFGVAAMATFRVRISDPIKRAIVGSYLQ